MRRSAGNLHQVLQDARKACPDIREIIDLRDRAYGLERTAELLFNGAKNDLDFAVAKRSEEQAIASHEMAVSADRLNKLAAFFFPIATLTALFGVNLQHGFEDVKAPVGFIVLIVVGIVLGFILKSFVEIRIDGSIVYLGISIHIRREICGRKLIPFTPFHRSCIQMWQPVSDGTRELISIG